MYRGDIRLDDTIHIKFTTRSFSTGAPTQLAGTPTVAAYPNNSITEITAGITLTVDFDAHTGLNNVRVVATSGNGYATATNYDLVITAGTVGGVSVVGEVVGSFSIEARSALMPTTAARTLDVSTTGEAGLDWANIGSPTTAQNLSGTTVDLIAGAVDAAAIATGAIDADAIAADAAGEIADAVWDEDATAHQTLGTFGQAIGDPVADANTIFGAVVTGAAGATIAADIISVQADTDNIQTRIPAALVGGRMDSDVGAMQANTVTAAAIATGAIDADALAADAANEIRDAVWAKAMAELAAVPAVTASVLDALEWCFLLSRNKITQTSTTQTLRNDADSATIGASTLSDDGTVFTRGEFA